MNHIEKKLLAFGLAVAVEVVGSGGALAQPAPTDPAVPAAPVQAEPPPNPETPPMAPDAATPAPSSETPPAPTTTAGPASPTERVPPPPEGKGQIVFFRPGRLGGAALSFSVHEGDIGVGKLGNGSYFILVADPGPHEYTVESEATDRLHLEVEPGETQYVEQSIGMGIMMGRPHLTPSDKATFDAKKSLKLSTKKPADRIPKTGS